MAAREVRRGADDWRGWRSAGGGHEEAAVPLAARRTQERERGEVEAGEMEREGKRKRERGEADIWGPQADMWGPPLKPPWKPVWG